MSYGNPALALHGPQICPNLIEASPDSGWQPNDDGRHRRHLRSHDDEIGIEKGNVVLIFAKWSPRMIDTVHMANDGRAVVMLLLSIFFRNLADSTARLRCVRLCQQRNGKRWEKLTSSPLACGRESHHDPDKFASRMISAFFMLSVCLSVSVSENGSGDSRRETTPLALIMTDRHGPSDGKPRGDVHSPRWTPS